MKLNIEELAREAGSLPDNSHPAPETKHMRAKVDALNRFAQLIVERCAVECENTPTALTLSGEFFSERCAKRVRKLLEAE